LSYTRKVFGQRCLRTFRRPSASGTVVTARVDHVYIISAAVRQASLG